MGETGKSSKEEDGAANNKSKIEKKGRVKIQGVEGRRGSVQSRRLRNFKIVKHLGTGRMGEVRS